MKAAARRVLLPLVLVCMAVVFSLGISAQTLDVGIPVEEYPELFIGRTCLPMGRARSRCS